MPHGGCQRLHDRQNPPAVLVRDDHKGFVTSDALNWTKPPDLF